MRQRKVVKVAGKCGVIFLILVIFLFLFPNSIWKTRTVKNTKSLYLCAFRKVQQKISITFLALIELLLLPCCHTQTNVMCFRVCVCVCVFKCESESVVYGTGKRRRNANRIQILLDLFAHFLFLVNTALCCASALCIMLSSFFFFRDCNFSASLVFFYSLIESDQLNWCWLWG